MNVIHPSATIASCVELGDNVRVGPGARVGQAGFGWEPGGDGWVEKPHEFGVVIGDDVVIGANTCIDRGSWRDTVIGSGTKIDNLVHIAHNVHVGERCLIVAGAEISGSVTVGDDAYIAPNAAVRERITIGARSVVGLGAVVVKDVRADVTVAGVPAREVGPADGPPPPPRREAVHA